MELLLPAVVANIPILAIAFVAFLLLYKLFAKIRSKFKVLVNCWFCNRNTKVPYDLRNTWDCPSCEQYNGFTQDGDYNRDIPGQLSYSGLRFATTKGTKGKISRGNGLCETCNEHQRIKVEKLAQFEPKNERSFEKELEKYRTSLEEKYRLCVSCERHLSKVLREKKKMIIGSKLAAFVFQKINVLKVPDIRMMKCSKRGYLKQLSTLCLLALGLVNLFITLGDLSIKRDHLGKDSMSQAAFVALSHLVALGRVISGYIQQISGVGLIEKSYLYARTLVALCCYTMGLPLGRPIPTLFVINSWSLSYGSIFLAFVNNILDGFKIGKSALLLTMWSIFAGVANSNSTAQMYGMEIIKVLTSIATVVLAFPSFKSSDKILLDSTESSFHRIYSEDYLSDDTEDASSTLNSTLLNSSSKSNSLNSSGNSVRSFSGKSTAPHMFSPNKHHPDFSSSFSLNSPAPAASFRQYISEDTTLQNRSNSLLNSSFLNSTMQSCRSDWSQPFSTASQASFISCAPLNQTLSVDLSAQRLNNSYAMANSFAHSPVKSFPSYPASSPVPFATNNSVCRRNLVSPSRLGAQAFVVQPSWVSGGYFNSPNKFGQKNYFLETASPKGTLSRASSQSSGFESQGSSVSMQNGEQIFSRENSHCHDEHYSSQYDVQFDKLNGRSPMENSIGLLPQLQSEKPFNSPLGFTQQPLPLALSPAPSCHSLGTNCFSNGTVFNSSLQPVRSTASPFDDLNKMGEDLPCIQKGSLLRKWKEKNLVL